jgi:FtsP/CotA-like multicopper oxidase with cupredoxin domain
MFSRRLLSFSFALAILFCLDVVIASAQNGKTVQGGGSFMVQCPQYTPLHPAPAILPSTFPYTTPTTSAQDSTQNYVGPVSFVENVPDVPNPSNYALPYPPVPLTYISHGGAIKCQEISGGDGMMTEADGNQTFMFSFGPLSGLNNIKNGMPGTLINSEFNGSIDPATGALMTDSSGNIMKLYYNSPSLPSVCGPASPSNCSTAGAAGISAEGSDPTFDPSKKTPEGATYINTNAGIADPATIMTVGVIDGNIPMPMAAFDEDDEFFLTLSNVGMIMRPDLFEQHTVHFHGYPNASSYYDGVPDATWAINIGGSATYYYLAPDAGTYFYHCHITPPEHLQMGMVGQLYVRPRQNRVVVGGDLYQSLVGCKGAANCAGPGTGNAGQQSDLRTACNTSSVTNQDILCSTPVPQTDSGFTQVVDPFAGVDPRIPSGTRLKYAYNDGDGSTWYDIDAPVQIHGFDPNFHFVGMTFNPEGFADMKDKYFLLNGRSYPDTVGVPGYCDPSGGCGGPTVAAATAAGSPDPATNAIGTEDTDGRTRFSQPLPSLITLYSGERALLRLSDLDVTEYQTLASLGIPMQLVGFQAKLLRDQAGNDLPITTNSVTIGGGESVDVILDSCLVRASIAGGAVPACTTPIPRGTYFLYTTNLDHLSNDAENFGGLMTEVVIK